MELSERDILLRIIELVIVSILIIVFFPAEWLNNALGSHYSGWIKNIYLTTIIVLTILALAVIANWIVSYILPAHHGAETAKPPAPERFRLDQLRRNAEKEMDKRSKARKQKEEKEKALEFWHNVLYKIGLSRTETEKMQSELDKKQGKRKKEIENKLKKVEKRMMEKPKSGWLSILKPKPLTGENIKRLEDNATAPKRIKVPAENVPVPPTKAIQNNAQKESIFNRVPSELRRLKHEWKAWAKRRKQAKATRLERKLKGEEKQRLLEAVKREAKARREAFVKRIEGEGKLRQEEKDAKGRLGEVAKELSEDIRRKDAKLEEGEPESPVEKAKRSIIENIRQMFHPKILARYGIRLAELNKLKMRRKEIQREKKKLETQKREFEQKKKQEEKLKRILEQPQMKLLKRQKDAKAEMPIQKKAPEHLNSLKMQHDKSRLAAEERLKREDELRRKQIEADRRKEEYRKKIEDEKLKREKEAKGEDEGIKKEIYRLLEKMAEDYVKKDYNRARTEYAEINTLYGELSMGGKASIKPIINKVVNKINQ